jgi:hypothetical protein
VIDAIVAEDDQIEVNSVARDAAAASRTMRWCLLIRFRSRWIPKSAARKEAGPENELRIPIEIKSRQHIDRVRLRCQSRRGEAAVQRRKGVVKNITIPWRSVLIPET